MRACLRRHWFGVAVFLLGALALARTQQFYGRLLHGWDAQHYFATARSLVFDRDLDIDDDLQQTPYPAPFDGDADGHFERVFRDRQGRIVSHYPIGLSLLELPFLALGYGARQAACIVGMCPAQPAGYSDLEIWFVALGLVAIFSAGAQLLYAILRPHVPSPWREAAMLSTWFGTSLFYYSSVFPFMSHAIGFVLVVWCVFIAGSILDERPRRLALLGVALGSLFLVRPQQLTLALPVALMLAPLRERPVRLWLGWAMVGLVGLLGLMALQALIFRLTLGEWTVNAYASFGGEFDWAHPALSTVLLSTNSGILWVSPIVVPAALGYFGTAWQRIPRPFAAFALQALMQVYVIACWKVGQADTFGSRMWVECTAAVACGLGLLYVRVTPPRRLIVTAATVACAAWTTRLLYLYILGRLRSDVSHLECVRRVLGL